VELPDGVTVEVSEDQLNVKGPRGSLARKIASGIRFEQTEKSVRVHRETDSGAHRSNHGLMRALLWNMVVGVSEGFTRNLEIVGVGYKAETKGKKLVMSLGFSHLVEFPFPDGIEISVNQNTKVSVFGIDKEQVGHVAAVLRGFRPPDSYKGKGVRYEGERIRLKAGKAGQ